MEEKCLLGRCKGDIERNIEVWSDCARRSWLVDE